MECIAFVAENSAVNRHNLLMLSNIPSAITKIIAIDMIPQTVSDRERSLRT